MVNPTISGWPVTTIEFKTVPTDNDINDWLSSMEALLTRETPFCIILLTKNKGMSHDAKRTQSIWFKKNRTNLSKFCIGIIRVVQKDQTAERLVGEAIKKAMPFKLMACHTISEAKALANTWLLDSNQGKYI